MATKHSTLTDTVELHVPKGFTEAPNNYGLIKNAAGQLEWVDKSLLGGAEGPAGTLQSVTVVDASNPTELNALSVGVTGKFVIAVQVVNLAPDVITLYWYDTANSVTENAPYTMTTADGGNTRWCAISGKYTTMDILSDLGSTLITANQTTKLSGIETAATADQSDSEIKTAYENNSDTNAFTDSEKTQLAGIKSPTNVVNVHSNPGTGEFSTVQAAIDSITTATETNPFVIKVAAGEFLVTETIVLKSHVSIDGEGPTTIIKITDETKPLFTAISDVTLSNMHVFGSGIGGSSVPLITYAGSNTGTINEDLLFINVSFGATYRILDITCLAGNLAKVIVRNCEFRCQYLKNGFKASGDGTTFIYIDSFVLRSPFVGVAVDKFFDFSDPNCTAIINDIIIEIASPATFTNLLTASNGVNVSGQGVYVNNLTDGIKVLNSGAAPDVNISSVSLYNVSNKAVDILHPSTTGSITGTFADDSLINIASPSPFAISHTIPSGGFSLIGDLRQGDKNEHVTNLSQFIREGGVTGIIEGGDLSSPSALNVTAAAGCGYLKGPTEGFINEVVFTEQTISVTDGINNFMSIDEDGNLQATTTPPPFEEVIFLGRAVARNGSILYIENAEISMVQYDVEVEKFFRFTLGPLYRSGSIVSENGTRQLNVTGGVYNFGVKAYAPAGGTIQAFDAFYDDGFGGDTIQLAETTVSNSLYDDASGTLAAIPTSKFIKHGIYTVGDGANEHYLFQYGQEIFDTQLAAQEGNIPTTGTAFAGSVVLIATIIVQEGATNFVEIRDERPVLQFKASGASASSDHGSLLNLTDIAHHPGYLALDGTRSMASALDMGTNSINNVGNIDGVDVSGHAARHLPTGADPLTTAAPTTNLDGSSTNGVGLANSLSRSDHAHAINDATVSEAGLLSAADKVNVDANTSHVAITTGNPHSLDSDDVSEGSSNLYHTEARVRTHSSQMVTRTQVLGSTDTPSRNNGAYTLLNEMTHTFTPGDATNTIIIKFNGSFEGIDKDSVVSAAIFIDSVEQANATRVATVKNGKGQTIVIEKHLTLSAASHTIEIQWKTVGDLGAEAIGDDRILIIEEIDE